jgi:hypothetical protein
MLKDIATWFLHINNGLSTMRSLTADSQNQENVTIGRLLEFACDKKEANL